MKANFIIDFFTHGRYVGTGPAGARGRQHRVRAGWAAILLALVATLLSGAALGQSAPAAAVVKDVPVADGTERVLFQGDRQARAIVVLLPGGDGIIGLDGGGGVDQAGGNFLVRTLGQWVAQGFAVVLPDAPNGTSLTGRRHVPAYADAISRAIDFGRSQAALPVWLIGTSAGTAAAVNGAAHLGAKVSGAVLTSSVTRRLGASGETIFDAEPGAVAVPALVVGNEYDSCPETPPGNAPMVLSALTRSPRKELVMVRSGEIAKRSDPCQGMSPHGYLGIEGTVVQRISEWIRAGGGG